MVIYKQSACRDNGPMLEDPRPSDPVGSEAVFGSGQLAFQSLIEVCAGLQFERHSIAAQLDPQGRYEVELDREFPLHVRLFQFRTREFTTSRTWHERLELFLPLDGRARLRMGEHGVDLEAGDMVLVESLKVHNVEDFSGLNTRVVVVSFLPEFVYSPGATSHDYAFLLPFYSRHEGPPQILHRADELAAWVYGGLVHLLDCYFHREVHPHFRAGCKAALLSILYQLTRRFQTSDMVQAEFIRHQQLARRLTVLFDYLRHNYSQRTTIRQAAQRVNMSDSHFMKVFRRVAGMSFVAYLNHLRVSNALRLLKSSTRTIAEIAADVGFADQSYLDRRFKQAFGMSPRECRLGNGDRPLDAGLSKKNAETF
jgi:AraC-like DNA-binding protein/mannose-6-phosphate isomerase-like protein (cupin superfamily)